MNGKREFPKQRRLEEDHLERECKPNTPKGRMESDKTDRKKERQIERKRNRKKGRKQERMNGEKKERKKAI